MLVFSLSNPSHLFSCLFSALFSVIKKAGGSSSCHWLVAERQGRASAELLRADFNFK